MDTLDEQLETAQAKIAEQDARITAQGEEITALTAANDELKANLAHAQEQLAASETACAKANAEVQQLRAEAKSAEERAAEYYGTPAKPQQVTAKGDPAKQRTNFTVTRLSGSKDRAPCRMSGMGRERKRCAAIR